MERLVMLVTLVLSASVLCMGVPPAHGSAGTLTTVTLPGGVSLQVPAAWTVLSHGTMGRVDAATEFRAGQPVRTAFAASGYDPDGKLAGSVQVRRLHDVTTSQDEVRSGRFGRLSSFDRQVRRGVAGALEATGAALAAWRGTRVVTINGIAALRSDYRRVSAAEGAFEISVLTVLASDRSFTVTVSTRDDTGAAALAGAGERILASLSLGGITPRPE